MGCSSSSQKGFMLSCAGIASLWTWLFCLLPSVGISSPAGAAVGGFGLAWLSSLLAGLVVNVCLVLISNRVELQKLLLVLPIAGSALQITSSVLLLSPGIGLPGVVVGGILAGAAIALLWLPWGISLACFDVAYVEKAVIGALACTSLGYALAMGGFVFAMPLGRLVLLLLPIVNLGLFIAFVRVEKSKGIGEYDEDEKREVGLKGAIELLRSQPAFMRMLLQCIVAYGLVSFAWEWLRAYLPASLVEAPFVFAMGYLVAAVVLWLFATYATHVDVASSIQWVFPISALGIVLGADSNSLSMLMSMLFLAVAHASFEGMLRSQVMAFAKRLNAGIVLVIILGFAAISVGVLMGVLVFYALQSFAFDKQQLALYLLAALVCFGLICLPRKIKAPDNPPSVSKVEVCASMAKEYGLTPREEEILGYLVEGRSHPYIRDELVISKSTVDTHVRHIYAKLGISSKQDLISMAKVLQDGK